MAVRLESYVKEYGSLKVLDIPYQTWEPGLYWIQGENGSGKSTLFKSMAGLIPFKGDVVLHESIRLKSQPVPYRSLVTYSEAEPSFPGFLTGRDLLLFVARCRSAPSKQVEEVTLSLHMDYLLQPCATYSSGMLKKLSLSMAFIGTPQLILLDEPLVTLDELARKNFYEITNSLLKKNVVILLSSHQSVDVNELPVTGRFEIRNKHLASC